MSKTDPTKRETGHVVIADCDWNVEHLAQIQQIEQISEEKVDLESASAKGPIIPGPIQLAKNNVSGRYRSQSSGIQLELRVDVDGKRPMNKLSGDFYTVSGATTTYFGSFIVESVTLNVTNTTVTVQGLGRYTWAAGYPVLRVTIPRTTILQPRAPATAQFLKTDGSPGAQYVCPFVSIYFRTVQYEQDWVSNVTTPVFTSYNTGSLPSGGPARVLSVSGAYAEAGIEMQSAGIWDAVPISEAGADAKWSDSELHASMVKHFSMWADVPQWKVWLLACQLHEMGSNLYGIMFDYSGSYQRQGCAVFHQGIGGTTPDKLRLQLYTYVHELGHCYNLMHSWQKSYANPPIPNRPSALSWMNYPWNYPGGANAFWNGFPFQFDDPEIIHVRHGFRNNVIMGGNPFATGAAVEDPQAFSNPVEDKSGLKLELRAKSSFSLGEPVVVEIKLSTTDLNGIRVSKNLHPNTGSVGIGIQNPGGQVVAYEPMIEHCVAGNFTTLNAENPSIYDSAFLSYGKGGMYFNQIGTYKIRAVYPALDGSMVLSNVLSIRVKSPHSSSDEDVADLFLGDQQGTILYLLGSDSEFLDQGNKALGRVITEFGDHPLSVYAKLVKGFNAGRTFKTLTPDKTITVRPAQYNESINMLSDVIDASEKNMGVDNITLSTTMLRMANVQRSSGDAKSAKETAEHMVDFFSKKGLKSHIMKLIESQAKELTKKK